MASILSTGVLILFLVSLATAFLVPFFTGSAGQIKFSSNWASVKYLALFLLPFLLLFCAGLCLGSTAAAGLRYFVLGVAAPFILSRLNFSARTGGVLLLLLSFLITALAGDANNSLICLLSGLVVWKSIDVLFLEGAQTLEDILPAIIWLGGGYWINMVAAEAAAKIQWALLASTLAVALLMRVIQGPFLNNDRLYLKRIMLAATGGLGLLIVINKLILAPALGPLAALMGAGLFVAYLMESLESPVTKWPTMTEAIQGLVVVGLLTLAATRLFGTIGLIALAPTTLVAVRSAATMQIGLFWLVQVLLQVFVVTYNFNITGINLMHPYTSAGLYAGILAALLISVVLREGRLHWLTAAIFLGAATLMPICFNYLLHEEPTGGLLVSLVVASLLLVLCAPSMYKQDMPLNCAMMLFPAQVVAVALLSGELIFAGNQASLDSRLIFVIGMSVVLIVGLTIARFTARAIVMK